MLEPVEVLSGELSEGDAAPTPLLGVALEQRLFGVVFTDEGEHPLGGLGLGEHSVGSATAPPTPASACVQLYPGTAQRADHRLTVAGPFCVPERASSALADERSGAGIRCH